MKATFLREIPTTRATMETFGGYDHRVRITEGNFFDVRNLSAHDYPVMSTRHRRIRLADVENAQGVLVKDAPAWVANGKLYYNGEEVAGLVLSEGDKKLVSMGERIIIYPDMLAYNTATGGCELLLLPDEGANLFLSRILFEDSIKDHTRFTAIPGGQPLRLETYTDEEEDSEWYEWTVDDSYVPVEGSTAYVGDMTFSEQEGKYEYTDRTIYRYTNEEWVPLSELESDIIIFEYSGLGVYGKYEELNALRGRVWLGSSRLEKLCCEIVKVEKGQYTGANGWIRLYLKTETTVSNSIFLEKEWFLNVKTTPLLDGIIENNNRLWGWRRGTAMNGEAVNEIYATALGEPSKWQTFEGIASDSFTASVGSDGPFTGAAYFSGGLYFFKENCFHRVMGSKPSNFQITTFSCYGVEEGSERSLVVAGDAMYYKGTDGIYCYDGSIPYKISEAFGEKKYKNAVGSVLGNRIFFDMEDEAGERALFVYDTDKKMWMVEDSIGVKQFAPAYGNLIAMGKGRLWLVSDEVIDEKLNDCFGESMAREGAFSWFGEFGDFGLSDPDAKYVSKLLLRMTVDEGARVTVEVMCDSDGSWRTAAVVSSKNKKSWCLPVVTPRCDHFRLRLSGEGGFKLWTLTREIESTNEVRK